MKIKLTEEQEKKCFACHTLGADFFPFCDLYKGCVSSGYIEFNDICPYHELIEHDGPLDGLDFQNVTEKVRRSCFRE